MIGAFRKIADISWPWTEPESREDKLARLAAELRSMTEEEKRRFIRRVWPEAHYAVNPPKGISKKRKEFAAVVQDEIEGRKRMDAEDIRKEGQENVE
jgi:hypothetical protein